MTNTFVAWPYRLRRGHSANPAEGACAVDAANWLTYGRHGDDMPCASPVIRQFMITGNDQMPDDVRQRLLPFLYRLPTSRSDVHEAQRLRIIVLAAVRVFVPRALDYVGLKDAATKLRALPDDTPYEVMRAAAHAAYAAACAADASDTAAYAAACAADASDTAAYAAYAAAHAPAYAARAAANAAYAAARAAAYAADAAACAAHAAAWDDYFIVLDQALSAGPQGEAWSADAIATGVQSYAAVSGRVPEYT